MSLAVVQSHPGAERRAQDNIQRQGISVYCPRFRTERVVGARVEVHEHILFPRYMFAEAQRSLAGTFGVASVIFLSDLQSQRLERELAGLCRQERHGFVVLPQRWEVGQALEVTAGVFIGWRGIYEGMCGRDRVHVLLSGLGGEVRVEVSERDLAAA